VSRWAGRALFAALGLLCALNVVYLARSRGSLLAQVTTPRGSQAPDFALPLLDGGTLRLGDERGHPVGLVFFASWCEPCKIELPGVNALARSLRSTGHTTRLYAVNTEGDRARAQELAQRLELTLPIAIDDGSVASAYRVQTIPHTVLLDGDGKVAAVLRGMQSEADLRAAVDAIERRGAP